MRKLKELWQLIKGICKDRTPYIVVRSSTFSGPVLAWGGSREFGADEDAVFTGDWDAAYRFMQHRMIDSRHQYRIAIAGDVPELRYESMLAKYY